MLILIAIAHIDILMNLVRHPEISLIHSRFGVVELDLH